jgi:hypothetical protein
MLVTKTGSKLWRDAYSVDTKQKPLAPLRADYPKRGRLALRIEEQHDRHAQQGERLWTRP